MKDIVPNEQSLNQVLNYIQSNVNDGLFFAKQEAPLIAQEMLNMAYVRFGLLVL